MTNRQITRLFIKRALVLIALVSIILLWSTLKDSAMTNSMPKPKPAHITAPIVPMNNPAPAIRDYDYSYLAPANYFLPAFPESPIQWIDDTLAASGIYPADNIQFSITDINNCGSAISPKHTGGGCTHHNLDGTIAIDISPSAIYTPGGVHIIFHEYAHAIGITAECSAEAYAHQYSAPDVWSYPQCQRAIQRAI